jgi:hypothetical protein
VKAATASADACSVGGFLFLRVADKLKKKRRKKRISMLVIILFQKDPSPYRSLVAFIFSTASAGNPDSCESTSIDSSAGACVV